MGKLKLSHWSKIANIFGAAAVVVSLVFVGLQVRENSRALRSQNQRSLVDSLEQLLLIRISKPEFAEIIYRAENGGELKPIERARLDTMAYLFINNWQQTFLDHHNGLIEPDIFRGYDDWMMNLMNFDYFRNAVEKATSGDTYSREFVKHIQQEVRVSPNEESAD